ncbi:MAG TPA: tetratricopeptide repeat protein [Candidatus Wunengus sp. YC65]|uniref:tetratricopeptide repeat protein n=1 Tax=Candidatus Wunengus sp. YC65 TaxID=3367701 RepID=UPI00402A585E
MFCGLIVAYYTQKWLGSFQTFLGAAWGLCFGMLIIKFLESKRVPLLETIQQKRRFLVVSLITLSTLTMKGDYNRAVTEYKTLISGNPNNAALHNNLGTVYYRNGNYDLAIEEYKKSIQLDEDLIAAYGNIGLVFLKQGNVEDAIPFLRKVFLNEEGMLKYMLTLYNSSQGKNG